MKKSVLIIVLILSGVSALIDYVCEPYSKKKAKRNFEAQVAILPVPEIEVISPAKNTVSFSERTILSGRLTPKIEMSDWRSEIYPRIYIDDKPISVNSDGQFSTLIDTPKEKIYRFELIGVYCLPNNVFKRGDSGCKSTRVQHEIYRKYTEEEGKQKERQKEDDYQKAILLFNQKSFDKSLLLFYPGYKDSDKYIEIILRRQEEATKRKMEAFKRKEEAERRRQVAAEKRAQAAFARTRAGRICAKNKDWDKMTCLRLADDEIWLGMTIGMLIAQRGQPDSYNPSNYGDGEQRQYCWNNWTPSCVYDDNQDYRIDAYN
ncbi:hypothetical protein K8I61_07445 [bacterium]|nr:hypothetical protein [bacterium]